MGSFRHRPTRRQWRVSSFLSCKGGFSVALIGFDWVRFVATRVEIPPQTAAYSVFKEPLSGTGRAARGSPVAAVAFSLTAHL
jgi:hypothetical protein